MDPTLTMAAVMHELGKLLEHLLLGRQQSILLNWTLRSARRKSSPKSIQQSNAITNTVLSHVPSWKGCSLNVLNCQT